MRPIGIFYSKKKAAQKSISSIFMQHFCCIPILKNGNGCSRRDCLVYKVCCCICAQERTAAAAAEWVQPTLLLYIERRDTNSVELINALCRQKVQITHSRSAQIDQVELTTPTLLANAHCIYCNVCQRWSTCIAVIEMRHWMVMTFCAHIRPSQRKKRHRIFFQPHSLSCLLQR